MYYVGIMPYDENYLEHYGIPGMKWGIRRNKDRPVDPKRRNLRLKIGAALAGSALAAYGLYRVGKSKDFQEMVSDLKKLYKDSPALRKTVKFTRKAISKTGRGVKKVAKGTLKAGKLALTPLKYLPEDTKRTAKVTGGLIAAGAAARTISKKMKNGGK